MRSALIGWEVLPCLRDNTAIVLVYVAGPRGSGIHTGMRRLDSPHTLQ
jgi:hypothetical protein